MLHPVKTLGLLINTITLRSQSATTKSLGVLQFQLLLYKPQYFKFLHVQKTII